MRKLIKKILKESDDLEWVKGNPISVGKCFTLYKSDGGIDAIVTIKEMEQREWKDNIYQKGGKFDPDNITIHLVGVNKNAKERVGSSFRISYNDLVENINDGDLAPTDCVNNINESDDLDWIKDVPNIYIGMCLIKYNYGGGTNQYIVKEIDSEDVVTLEEINGWPDDEYDIDDLTDLIADGSFKPC